MRHWLAFTVGIFFIQFALFYMGFFELKTVIAAVIFLPVGYALGLINERKFG